MNQPPLVKLSDNLSILLLDRLHGGHASQLGNKYYKLMPNLARARQLAMDTLVTFGGAWSNHIYAVAKEGRQQGFKTVGIIRGECPPELSLTLQDARQAGMQLEFISRTRFRDKTEPELMAQLKSKYGEFYLLPEGGTNELAVQGCQQIVSDLAGLIEGKFPKTLVLPVGTGGTLAGVIAGLSSLKNSTTEVLGISVLKGGDYLNQEVGSLLKKVNCSSSNWSIETNFHCGGYARCPVYLRDTILDFEKEYEIQLDPVYTGKMMYAIDSLIKNGSLDADQKIVAIHTGGLQGRRGFDF